MAGPGEQSADASLDDILSSIRKIVSDDLNGAEQLRQRMDAAQAIQRTAETGGNGAIASQQAAQQSSGGAPEMDASSTSTENVETTAALIAAARAAAGTPARDYVAAEPRVSQAELSPPRESLAPFDRSAQPGSAPGAGQGGHTAGAPETSSRLEVPIVLPTELDGPEAGGANAALTQPVNGQHVQASVEAMEQPSPATAPEQGGGDQIQTNGAHASVPQGVANGATRHCAIADPDDQGPLDLGPPTEVVGGSTTHAEQATQQVTTGPDKITTTKQNTAQQGSPGLSSSVIEQTVTRMLRPMLKEWLDENMPRLIEQALREDVLNDGDK